MRMMNSIFTVNNGIMTIGFALIFSALVFSIPVSAQGPPEGAGPPSDAGPPEGAGPPGDIGPPSEDLGPPAHAGPPEDAGPPGDVGPPSEDLGPPAHAGPPENAGPPDDVGPPSEDLGPPAHAGPPEGFGKPEGVGKPDGTGPPEGVPAGGFGGIVATEDIVGIEELSTLNVGGSKNAGMHIGPRALGTPLLEISSDSVCGDTLCDEPMSIQEKIQMYLQSRGLTVPER